MSVVKKDVEYIRQLARLHVDDSEAEALTGDLNRILEYVEKLNELDTDHVEILVNPIYIENVYREDVVETSLSGEDFLMNAPDRTEDYLKVPTVIEREEI